MNKKWIILAIIVLAAGWYSYKKYYANRGPQNTAVSQPDAPLPPLGRAGDNSTMFGTLVIYDPTVADSPLKGLGFTPQAWYLVPDSVGLKKGTASPALDFEVYFDDNSVCTELSDQNLRWSCNSKGQVVSWGYGERVKIQGLLVKKQIEVSAMTLVNY